MPFCYFAYRRNIKGIVLTLLALASSMFRFPEPEHVNPEALEYLAAEKEYLTDDWTLAKVLISLANACKSCGAGLCFLEALAILWTSDGQRDNAN